MSTFALADAVDDVLPQLAADPSAPVTEAAIRNAAIEFCQTAQVWRFTQEDASLTAGERAIELEPDMGADVSRVEAVRHRGVILEPVHQGRWASEEARHQGGCPLYWTQQDSTQILLLPTPGVSENGTVAIDMVLQPSRAATTIPAWIWVQWGEAITAGAIGRLLLMPAKPWSAPDLAVVHLQRFHNVMYAARGGTLSNRGKSPLRTRSFH